ncbi:MAG: sigma-54-dependent Fis family transcriptional regulator, partial [Myxococcales bacterium]|nr:sigma-54-dependent Fis family transcriptional regulator [Myxococcales bacterium]
TRRDGEIIGAKGSLKHLFSLVESVARLDVSVLVHGESGTGKELVARAVHSASPRRDRRMVSVNCGALSEALLESELFGHAKGAFTGADRARAGLFEEADRSTLFLDEVGELSMSTQVKLLRVLQEGEIRPVGSNRVRRVDVRVVAATHRKLPRLVDEGSFREDLYFRLNVVGVHVPALRERREEIPDLAYFFLARHGARLGKVFTGIEPACMQVLSGYSWPGNVRELENAVIRAMAVSDGPLLRADALPPELRGAGSLVQEPAAENVQAGEVAEYAEARRRFEQTYLRRLLAAGGNLASSARIAGLDPSNLRRMLKRHGMKT